MTPRAASNVIPVDIFDLPLVLSTKQIGVGLTWPPRTQWDHAISI